MERRINKQILFASVKKVLMQNEQIREGRIQRIDFEVSPNGVVVKYNVPLMNHSAGFELQYNKLTNQILIKALFLGPSFGSLAGYRSMGQILNEMEVISLDSIRLGPHEVSFSWKINEENLNLAIEEYKQMAIATLSASSLNFPKSYTKAYSTRLSREC